MTDFDAAFMQQIFDDSELKWKPDVHQHGQADNLRLDRKYRNGLRFVIPNIYAHHRLASSQFPLTRPNEWILKLL